jgi:pyridoxal 5'-phosphate synthase pdxT subunit
LASTIGILSLQGAVAPHAEAVRDCGAEARFVRTAEELSACDALIIPGGESTTMGMLMERFDLLQPIGEHARAGKPVLGTCAGMIVLSKDIVDSDQARLGLMDTRVARNSYGRQVESFESPVSIPALGGDDFPGVFIRAPHVEAMSADTETLAELDGRAVFVRQGRLLASAFHPELTSDRRLHEYFLGMVNS